MALITAAEAREYVPGLAGTGDDTQIAALVSACDSAMAKHCGFPAYDSTGAIHTFEDQSYTLYLPDGDDTVISDGARVLHLPRPISSITSIYEDANWGFGAAYEVASSNWSLDKQRGRVMLKPGATHGEWSTEWRALKVTAVLGYATVPEDLKLAAKLLVSHWYQLRSRHGKTSISGANISEGLRPEEWPDSVKQLVQPFMQRGALL